MTTKRESYGARLIASLNQAVAIERGEMRPAATARYKVTARHATASDVAAYPARKIKKIRKDMQVSQPVFAGILNVSPETVRAWEQGRRSPEGAALRLLEVAERHPQIMLQTIQPR